MIILDAKALNRERDKLNLIARDLNEFDDPLDNILMDVLLEPLYEQLKKKGRIPGSSNFK